MSSNAVSRERSISNVSRFAEVVGGTGVETLVEEEDIDGAVEWVEFRVVVVAVEAIDAISQQA